jgi:hypothetical protein
MARYQPWVHVGTPEERALGLLREYVALGGDPMLRMRAAAREAERIEEELWALGFIVLTEGEDADVPARDALLGCHWLVSNEIEAHVPGEGARAHCVLPVSVDDLDLVCCHCTPEPRMLVGREP